MYDARQIANWFIRRAVEERGQLSIMSALKLTYIAHGWYLETYKKPLIRNKIEAWKNGPVIPDVYHTFRKNGVFLKSTIEQYEGEIAPMDERFLQEIYRLYGHIDPFALSDLTHKPGTPWDICSRKGGHYAVIPNELIQAHYEKKRKDLVH